ncbi:MAG: peptide chain release factor 1 [Bacilli bacterium]|nr:peptide chain release factor 1 [Bacilli bacterium]
MIERLEIIQQRYDELVEELGKPEVLADYTKTMELSKEKGKLESTVNKYAELKNTQEEITGLKEMVNDPEMGEMARIELETAQENLKKIEDELQILLIPKDENDDKNIIMEIRGAAGGDEANIFAGDLFRMYSQYALKNGWKIEVLDEEPGAAGGYSQIEFMIKGDSVYSKLKYESGAHRVQRIPVTESNGRIQTSTATVAVMPEAEEIDFKLNMDEIRVDITRASGHGGQGVNTTDSAVRLTHIPTGIIVYAQTERSQIKNKEIAMKIMAARLYDLQLKEKAEKEGNLRRSMIGTGDRSEKIRTYNYPQSRVTDHRIGFTIMQLDRVMNGDLDPIIDALITEDQRRKLADEEAI